MIKQSSESKKMFIFRHMFISSFRIPQHVSYNMPNLSVISEMVLCYSSLLILRTSLALCSVRHFGVGLADRRFKIYNGNFPTCESIKAFKVRVFLMAFPSKDCMSTSRVSDAVLPILKQNRNKFYVISK
jgi:hypothetical protein